MAIQGGFISPGSYLNLSETDRQLIKAVARRTQQVAVSTDFIVAPGAGMQVTLTDGQAFIAGKNTTAQGYYLVWDGSSSSKAITTAHATYARIDRVILCIRDSQYGALPGGKSNGPEVIIVDGVPAASPVAASDGDVTTIVGPGGWYELAQVTVPANATSISAGNIVDKRVAGAGGSGSWVTAGFTAATGFSLVSARYLQVGSEVTLEAHLTRTGSNISADTGGGITDTNVLTIPNAIARTSAIPHNIGADTTVTNLWATLWTNVVKLTSFSSGSAYLNTGQFLKFTTKYRID